MQKGILQADERNPRILREFVLGKQAPLGWISCMEPGRYRRGQEMLCLQSVAVDLELDKGGGGTNCSISHLGYFSLRNIIQSVL